MSKQARLTLTVGSAMQARLRVLSRLTGRSQGAIIVNLMEEALPQLDRLIGDLMPQAAEQEVHDLIAQVKKLVNPENLPEAVRRGPRKQGPSAAELLQAIREGVNQSEVESARRRGKARRKAPVVS